jgi:putative effector of murein hydrolase
MLSYPMQGLQIQLLIGLDRYEAHLRPPDCLSNRLGVNVVALVSLYVRLDVLRRHQPHIVTLLFQSPS